MRNLRYPQQRKKKRVVVFALGILALSLTFFVGKLLISTVWPNSTTADASAYDIQQALERAKPLAQEVEYPTGPLAASVRFDKLVVNKAERRLYAYAAGKVVRVYGVALGFAPVGAKEVEGDGKTPEGKYSIISKSTQSAYYKNLKISYPNATDTVKAAQLNASAGGDIFIHGLAPEFAFLGVAHRASDWTLGCIAISNPEIDELFAKTPVGTPIELVP